MEQKSRHRLGAQPSLCIFTTAPPLAAADGSHHSSQEVQTRLGSVLVVL